MEGVHDGKTEQEQPEYAVADADHGAERVVGRVLQLRSAPTSRTTFPTPTTPRSPVSRHGPRTVQDRPAAHAPALGTCPTRPTRGSIVSVNFCASTVRPQMGYERRTVGSRRGCHGGLCACYCSVLRSGLF